MPPDEFDVSLETLLQGISLREPSQQLDARVLSTIANAQRFRFHLGYRLAVAAGVMLAVGIGVRLSLPRHAPMLAVIPGEPIPVRLERETSKVFDDGLIAVSEDAAYQQLRRQTIREVWIIDSATHARLQMTIPTEQILIQKLEAF